MVVDFGISQKRVCSFLLVISSNLGPIFTVPEILQVFWWKQPPHTYSTQNLGMFPLD